MIFLIYVFILTMVSSSALCATTGQPAVFLPGAASVTTSATTQTQSTTSPAVTAPVAPSVPVSTPAVTSVPVAVVSTVTPTTTPVAAPAPAVTTVPVAPQASVVATSPTVLPASTQAPGVVSPVNVSAPAIAQSTTPGSSTIVVTKKSDPQHSQFGRTPATAPVVPAQKSAVTAAPAVKRQESNVHTASSQKKDALKEHATDSVNPLLEPFTVGESVPQVECMSRAQAQVGEAAQQMLDRFKKQLEQKPDDSQEAAAYETILHVLKSKAQGMAHIAHMEGNSKLTDIIPNDGMVAITPEILEGLTRVKSETKADIAKQMVKILQENVPSGLLSATTKNMKLDK